MQVFSKWDLLGSNQNSFFIKVPDFIVGLDTVIPCQDGRNEIIEAESAGGTKNEQANQNCWIDVLLNGQI